MKKGLKFSFDVSALANYTDQEEKKLVLRSFFTPKTFQSSRALGADLETGIKSSKVIQKLAVSAVPQAGGSCSFNASGNQAFTQATITPGKVKYQDTLCPSDLEAKWTQKLLTLGQNYDENSITIDGIIKDALFELIGEHLEVADWQGDTGSVSAYLNRYNGLIKVMTDAGGLVDGNTAAIESLTIANTIPALFAMVDALPAPLKGKPDLVLYIGTDTFDKAVTNMFNLNMFNYTQETGTYEMTLPTKGVKLVGVHGLDGTNRMFLMRASNITWGTDMEGDFEEFEIWYSKDDRNIKYSVQFARGVQVAYPGEIVEFTLAS
jgi:hypothetical protein